MKVTAGQPSGQGTVSDAFSFDRPSWESSGKLVTHTRNLGPDGGTSLSLSGESADLTNFTSVGSYCLCVCSISLRYLP